MLHNLHVVSFLFGLFLYIFGPIYYTSWFFYLYTGAVAKFDDEKWILQWSRQEDHSF